MKRKFKTSYCFKSLTIDLKFPTLFCKIKINILFINSKKYNSTFVNPSIIYLLTCGIFLNIDTDHIHRESQSLVSKLYERPWCDTMLFPEFSNTHTQCQTCFFHGGCGDTHELFCINKKFSRPLGLLL